MKTIKTLTASAVFAAVAGLSTGAQAGTLTPDIIWGGGNTNQGFTVVTSGSLELGIRAKRRFPANDTIGDGIVQDGSGNYLFNSSESTAGPGVAMWSFDWGINSSFDGNGSGLDAFNYLISFDSDPTVNTAFTIAYDPLSAISTGYYLGTNSTGNGAASFTSATDVANGNPGDLSANNVAQNSVQPQWIGGSAGSGQFDVMLSAFDAQTEELVSSVTITAIVDAAAPIPLPAGLPLVLGGLGALYAVGRRKRS